jgi:murein DD-endopeptidase MepM/ murein hydrolase activator NlpD
VTLSVPGRLLAVAITIALLAPASATAQDLDQVEEQVDRLESDLQEAVARFEETEARVAAAEEELTALQERTAALEAEARAVTELIEARARAVFKHGGNTVLASFLSAEGPSRAVERAALMNAVTGRDQGRLESASNLRIQLQQTRELLAAKATDLEALEAEQAQLLDVLVGELESAKVLEADLARREARRRTIQRGVQNGIYACMFDHPFHFRDTWGAPRSGGRRHKGTDLFSYYGAPVYAFNGGRVQRLNNSGLGGISIYIWGDDGNQYYYTHLSGYADGVYVGKRVEAGEHIAYNGASGNASRSSPHVHFQLHPGGGAPVNPYRWLAAACF